MNIIRKPIKLEINEQELEMILDFESAITFQELYEKSIFVGIDKIVKEQDLKALACLIASCVKEDGKSIGLEFAYSLDLMIALPYFMEKIGLLMDNSLPKEDGKKKQIKKKI